MNMRWMVSCAGNSIIGTLGGGGGGWWAVVVTLGGGAGDWLVVATLGGDVGSHVYCPQDFRNCDLRWGSTASLPRGDKSEGKDACFSL